MTTTLATMSHETHDSEQVNAILQNIAIQGQRLKDHKPGSHEALLSQAMALVEALDNPVERVYSFLLAEPARLFAGRIASDMKIFETLAAENGRPKSVTELAEPCKASPKLVRRIARHLAATRMIEQTSEDEYRQNRIYELMSSAKYRDGTYYCSEAAGPAFIRMPEFLRQTKYQNPENINDGPFQFAHNSASHWAWLEEHPEAMQAFHSWLNTVRENRPSFVEPGFYPAEERLVTGLKLTNEETSDDDDGNNNNNACSAFVDIGGGTGHALAEFKTQVPSWPGRLVLQDTESVIELSKTEPHASMIEATVHDFFTPQPLKGARAYYVRYILHDWPDDECRTILAHLRDAMTPGYSKILIHDCVVADRDPCWQHTSIDLWMMALLATQERTEKEWRALIESVGSEDGGGGGGRLRITGIWSKGVGNLSVIEVMN